MISHFRETSLKRIMAIEPASTACKAVPLRRKLYSHIMKFLISLIVR